MSPTDISRIMAHEIEYEGMTYRNHILHLDRITGNVQLTPFRSELPFTVFVNGRIRVTVTHDSAGGKLRYDMRFQAY